MNGRVIAWLAKLWVLVLGPLVLLWRESLLFWRIFALVGWSAIVLSWYCREKLKSLVLMPEHRAGDTRISAYSDRVLSERHLLNFLDQLDHDHSYDDAIGARVSGFLRFFREEGSQYMLDGLPRPSSRLTGALRNLDRFVWRHFSSPRASERLRLHPHLNPKFSPNVTQEQERRYHQRVVELRNLVALVRKTNRRYRKAVNRLLPEARAHLSDEV